MNPFAHNKSDSTSRGLDDGLIKDLERQGLDQIRKLRKSQRLELRVPLVMRPGNASSDDWELSGTTADLSSGGCRAHFAKPVGVGDVYRLAFDDERVDAPLVYARCLRCSVVREDVFEAAFAFFSSVGIALSGEEPSKDLLD